LNRYIFTVTSGRSGQNTLANLVENYVQNSYVAFEEPNINCFFSGSIANIERRFRRNFIETHELLGRGKVLSSFERKDIVYIESIARKRINTINKNMKEQKVQTYVDISKYFARGLHVGFQRVLPKFSLIHLVRDPILNMRSFLNRNKNFYLDNSSPSFEGNILKMDSTKMELPDLYLWSWFEMALRYERMKHMKHIDRYVEIRTNKLNDSTYINKCFNTLGLEHTNVQENNIRLNTNVGLGYKKTEIKKCDIGRFEKFIDKVPNVILDGIPYLKSYNPHHAHQY
jgi:hypothetical protein